MGQQVRSPHRPARLTYPLFSPTPTAGLPLLSRYPAIGKTYGDDRLEAACRRALTIGANTYKSVESILKHHLDSQPLPQAPASSLPLDHDNLRGPDYFY